MWYPLSMRVLILFTMFFSFNIQAECRRSEAKKVLQDDLDLYITHTFEKVSNFFSFEEVETPDGYKIRIEQDGCNEYIERLIFTLPFGQTSPSNGNLLLQKTLDLLKLLKFDPSYKNGNAELVTTLKYYSKRKENYSPGEELNVKRAHGKEKVQVAHSRFGANHRKITITRIIDLWKKP